GRRSRPGGRAWCRAAWSGRGALRRPPRTAGRAPPPGDCRASRRAAAGAEGGRRTARAPRPAKAADGRAKRGPTAEDRRSVRAGDGGCAAPRPGHSWTHFIVRRRKLRLCPFGSRSQAPAPATAVGKAAIVAAYAAPDDVKEGP